MEKELTKQTPDYFAQSYIALFVNQFVLSKGDSNPANYGGRITTSLRNYLARKALLGEELGFELPVGDEATVKDPETGEVYFHHNYLTYATGVDRNIDGLSAGCKSAKLLEKFVKVHLVDSTE
jgi:hypothetical protein